MARAADIKLIDLLSLKPGSLLQLHPVTGEIECLSGADFSRDSGWQYEFSNAVFPGGDPQKIQNFSKLLEIPIEFQIIIRHPDDKVIEVHSMQHNTWKEILARVGHQADVMVDGRIVAHGEIVVNSHHAGILIQKLTTMD